MSEHSLQKTGLHLTYKNVGENGKYVGKGYTDFFHDVGKNVKRGIPDAVLVRRPKYHDVGNTSPDAMTCVGHSGIGSSSPDRPYADAKRGIGNASSDVFFSTSVVRQDTLLQHVDELLTSSSCGPSAWVPNQCLLSSLVVYPTPDRISHL
ncbi:hypothetical protein E6C27_scaffold550G001180 [Cucumis melo var. makuwa]|uniref:Uncharacterized protein n=1 Tax=Cucumis melo var. makuwa TaxID=1194695 RepID=A0A5A7VHY8_CUCMM|nr:hypothetical protein E6C27_scaffold550G001180 [Cucumis melo var. makuwa]